MKIGMSGIMFDKQSVESSIDAAACIGFDGTELRGNDAHMPDSATGEFVAKLKKRLADAGIAASSIATFTGHYASRDDAQCVEELKRFERYVQIAAALGAPNVRHWIGDGPSAEATPAGWEKAALWLDKAARYAKGFGVMVALELHHNTFLDTTEAALKVLKMAREENIGFIHDGVNFYFDDQPSGDKCIRALGDRIINVHLKDIVRFPSACNPRKIFATIKGRSSPWIFSRAW